MRSYICNSVNISDKKQFFKFMLRNKIKCSFHCPPIYDQPYYKKIWNKEILEMDRYYKDAITLQYILI